MPEQRAAVGRGHLLHPKVWAPIRVTVSADWAAPKPICRDQLSRIEQLAADTVADEPFGVGWRFLVEQPAGLPDELELPRQAKCLVSWMDKDGYSELRCELDGLEGNRSRRRWVLRVVRPATRPHRRGQQRVEYATPIVITVLAVAEVPARQVQERYGTEVCGGTLNIAEGGVLCILPGPAIPNQSTVGVQLPELLPDRTVPGTVLRVSTTGRPGFQLYETAVEFHDGSAGSEFWPNLTNLARLG
jgi:hypothetical protein